MSSVEGIEKFGRRASGIFRRFRNRSAAHNVESDIEQQHEAGAARINNTSVGQHLQHLGSAGKRIGTRRVCCFENTEKIRTGIRGGSATFGRNTNNSEDRSFDRLHDGAIGSSGGSIERSCERCAINDWSGAELGGQSTQDLRKDHTRISTSAHQRSVRNGLTGGIKIGIGAIELGHNRSQGEGHVGSGVAIGHGIDVQPVDGLSVSGQGIGVSPDERPEVIGGQAGSDRHRRRDYRCLRLQAEVARIWPIQAGQPPNWA